MSFLADPDTFSQWLYHEIPLEWVVFSKPPFKGPEEVVKYIGRYTHRCAISNNRIIAEKDGNIEFWFKNTKKSARWETTSLPVMNFMDRFLYHVLPKHFHRIRYYGFLANGKAKTSIESVRRDLAVETSTPEAPPEENLACPHCEQGNMITVLIIDGYRNVVVDETELADPVAVMDTT